MRPHAIHCTVQTVSMTLDKTVGVALAQATDAPSICARDLSPNRNTHHI